MENSAARLPMTMEYLVPSSLADAFDTEAASDFETLVKIHRPKVFRFMLASLRDPEAAENLTQDCFLNAYKARASFRNDCKVGTWLMQIAVNLLRDHAKNRRLQFWRRLTRQTVTTPQPHVCASLADHQQSPEAQLVLREQVQAIWKAAEVLPEKQRTVFLLRFVQDMDLADIAIATGLKQGTVKTHLFRALASIRQRLGLAL